MQSHEPGNKEHDILLKGNELCMAMQRVESITIDQGYKRLKVFNGKIEEMTL